MSRERRVGLTILTIILLLLVAVAAVFLSRELQSLRYTIVFKDAKGIQTGDRVMLNGVDIGEVKTVTLFMEPARVDVTLKVKAEHANKVRSDSTAVINSLSTINVSGQKVVEIINPPTNKPAPPMAKKGVIEGKNGMMELQLWKLRFTLVDGAQILSGKLDGLAENLQQLQEELTTLATSPEAKEAMAKLREFAGVMAQQGKAALVQLQEEWPKLQAELQPLLKELEKFDHDSLTRQLRQMMEQIDETLKQWEKEDPGSQPAATPEPGRGIAI